MIAVINLLTEIYKDFAKVEDYRKHDEKLMWKFIFLPYGAPLSNGSVWLCNGSGKLLCDLSGHMITKFSAVGVWPRIGFMSHPTLP